MTAPGMNLEFTASSSFRRRLSGQGDLLEAVKIAIQRRPQGAVQGRADFHSQTLKFGAQTLGVVYHRTGNRIGLVDIYQLPHEDALFESRLRQLGKREGL
jgi:hypothetical protein